MQQYNGCFPFFRFYPSFGRLTHDFALVAKKINVIYFVLLTTCIIFAV